MILAEKEFQIKKCNEIVLFFLSYYNHKEDILLTDEYLEKICELTETEINEMFQIINKTIKYFI